MATRQRSLRTTPWLATLTGAVLLVGSTAPPANAHNVLIDSSPEDGQQVDSVFEEVELIFNEEVLEGGNAISVVGPEGDTDFAEGADVRLDEETAAIDLDPLTEAGDYTVEYRIISADGHPIEESISFDVSEEAAQAAAEQDNDDTGDTGNGDATDAEADPDADAETDADAAANPLTQNVWLGAAVALAGIGIIVVLVMRLLRRPSNQNGNQNDETSSS